MGIGIDICSLDRIRGLLGHDRFLQRSFTEKERAELQREREKLESLAGRFACKEAVSKLLGTGFGPIGLHDIEILHRDSGQPYVLLSAKAEKLLLEQGMDEVNLSLSHDGGVAVAVVEGRRANLSGKSERDDFLSLSKLCKDQELNQALLRRDLGGYKYQYGNIGIIGGSQGMAGSVCLAAQAALRSGAGLVHAIVPASIGTICQIKLTEAIVHPVYDGGKGCFSVDSLEEISKLLPSFDALALGPGLGRSEGLFPWIQPILAQVRCPLILDADGLNLLARHLHLFEQIHVPLIITPHEMEMARLISCDRGEVKGKRQQIAEDFARTHQAIVVLKGHDTLISDGVDVYTNRSGNPGMATAGSGDVLTGMVTAFIGYGYRIMTGVRLATYIHGLAGDFLREKSGEDGMIARDLIAEIPEVMKILQQLKVLQ